MSAPEESRRDRTPARRARRTTGPKVERESRRWRDGRAALARRADDGGSPRPDRLRSPDPILITQRWSWWEAWVYAGLTITGFFGSRFVAHRRHPGLLDERAQLLDHQDTERFDRVLAPILGLGANLIPLAAGLEVEFLGAWSVPLPLTAAALLAVGAGYGFGAWALVENRFFSGTVRIQVERGHFVVDSGPYRFVRHPGYAGGLLMFAAAPLVYGVAWTGVFAGLICGVLVLRTALEDRTLLEKLPGYREYAEKTRYRLVPGLW